MSNKIIMRIFYLASALFVILIQSAFAMEVEVVCSTLSSDACKKTPQCKWHHIRRKCTKRE